MDFLNDFGVKPVFLAAQAVNFFLLLFILKKFLYKPILGMLEKRKEVIAESLKNAEEIEKKLQAIGDEREEALKKAGKEAEEIIKDATDAAGKIITEAHEKAGEDIKKMVAKSEEAMKRERDALHQEVRSEISNLVVLAMQKVTGKVISAKEQKDLIDKSIKELK